MKRLTYLLMVLATALLTATACTEKPSEPIIPDGPQPSDEELTAEYITDVWALVEWSSGLAEGSYCYLQFDGKNNRYDMWDNLGSMYANHRSGSFAISEEDGCYYIRGTYDNGVGDWNDSYEVEVFNFDLMDWISLSTGEVMRFRRIFELPEL